MGTGVHTAHGPGERRVLKTISFTNHSIIRPPLNEHESDDSNMRESAILLIGDLYKKEQSHGAWKDRATCTFHLGVREAERLHQDGHI